MQQSLTGVRDAQGRSVDTQGDTVMLEPVEQGVDKRFAFGIESLVPKMAQEQRFPL